jgi:zinc/manganese transport system permease protein
VFFLTLYSNRRSGSGAGGGGVSVLFGSILGLSATRALVTAGIGALICGLLVLIARPLLFASLDENVAAARGVPVRLLGLGFLALVGGAAAESSQVVGALLILGLLAAPAGAAMRLTSRPMWALALSAAIAVLSLWCGLTISYVWEQLPPSFTILSVAAAAYLLAGLAGTVRARVIPAPVVATAVSAEPPVRSALAEQHGYTLSSRSPNRDQ